MTFAGLDNQKLKDAQEQYEAAQLHSKLKGIKFEEIKVKPQARKEFEDEEQTIEELTDSIKQVGLIAPPTVRVVDGEYELVSGERRFRAVQILGGCRFINQDYVGEIPCMVAELNDEQALMYQEHENTHRKNYTILEDAARLKSNLDKLDGDIKALMAKESKSKTYISKRLGLLNLGNEGKRLVYDADLKDMEALNGLRMIEDNDPSAAKKIVDDIIEAKNDGVAINVRQEVQAVKDKIISKKKDTVRKKAPSVSDKGKDKGQLMTKTDFRIACLLAGYDGDMTMALESAVVEDKSYTYAGTLIHPPKDRQHMHRSAKKLFHYLDLYNQAKLIEKDGNKSKSR